MNNVRLIGTIVFVFFCCINTFGQSDCSCKKMIEKIDSVASVKNIQYGTVNFNEVTSMFEETKTRTSTIVNYKKFSFDGQFLVIDDKYFNIEKLLYFHLEKDFIDFYFQAY